MNSIWTGEQEQAILRTDSDLIVTASAGCGKTSTMIERALGLILRGTPVVKLTMLTFTEAAAAEMRDKLRKRLTLEAKAVEDEKSRAYLVSQIDDLPYAAISTIHGFCYGLVREFFEQIPLSPSVRILETDACDELKRKAFEALIKEIEGDPAANEMRFMIGLRDDSDLYAILNDVYEFMTNQPDREGWMGKMYHETYAVPFEATVTAKRLVSSVREEAVRVRDEAQAIWLTMDPNDKGRRGVQIVFERAKAYADIQSVRDLLAAYAETAQDNRSVTTNKSDYTRDIEILKDTYKKSIAGIAATIAALGTYPEIVETHGKNAPFVKLLGDLVLRFQALYTSEKQAYGGVDFADLERYALKILSDEDVMREIKARNEYVFLDEYQDINLVQSAIISRIAPQERLFAVGDSKQCIYRFREAEPQIFLDTLKRLKEQDKAVTFSHNFRSDNCVLRVVNQAFAHLMTPTFGGVDYGRTDKFALREDAGDHEDAVRIFLYDNERKGKPCATGVYSVKEAALEEEEKDNREGLAMVDYIGRHLGEEIEIKGKKEKLAYRHIAILVARRSLAERFVPTLLAAGIPLNLDTFAGDTGLRDVNTLLAFVDILDNGMQDYPLLTVLRSPLGGFGDAELASIRQADEGYKPFWKAFAAYAQKGNDALAVRVNAFSQKVREYAFAASFTSISTLLNKAIVDLGYVDYLCAQEDGLERLAALQHFIASLEGKSYAVDLPTLCAHFRAFPVTELGSVSVDNTVDRVTVSTMHASKGLEYPMVLLPALDDSKGGAGKKVVASDKYLGIGTEYYDGEKRTRQATFAKKVIEAQKTAYAREDKLRLLYVAMTRAKRYLFLSGAKKKSTATVPRTTDNFVDWLDYVIKREPSWARYTWVESQASATGREEAKTYLPLGEDLEEIVSAEYAFSAATRLEKKYTVTELNDREAGEDIQLPSFLASQEETRRGTLYHSVFQHVDYAAKTPGALEEELTRLVREGYVAREDADKIDLDKVARCIALPILQKTMEKGVRAYHEQRFVLNESAKTLLLGADEPVLVQGVIDLLMVEDDKMTVVDFKLSNRTEKALVEAYKVQLQLYCKAVEIAFKKPVTRCVLVEINRAEVIEMPIE